MPSISAVIFDLDDTLYPEREYAFGGFAAVAAEFEDRLGDRREAAAEMRQLFDSEHRRRVFNTILVGRGLRDDEAVIRAMIKTYRSHRPTISLYDDVEPTLFRLRSRYQLGLITDGPAVMQSAKIDALALRDRFDAIILTDELGASFAKPHRRAFERIMEQFAVEGSNCLYVADNTTKDFVAPNLLGWTTVQIKRTDRIHRVQAPADGGLPLHTVDTLDRLDAVLRDTSLPGQIEE